MTPIDPAFGFPLFDIEVEFEIVVFRLWARKRIGILLSDVHERLPGRRNQMHVISAQKKALCGSRGRRQKGFDCQNLIEPLSSNCIQEPQPGSRVSGVLFPGE
jgi:hypothetical protein